MRVVCQRTTKWEELTGFSRVNVIKSTAKYNIFLFLKINKMIEGKGEAAVPSKNCFTRHYHKPVHHTNCDADTYLLVLTHPLPHPKNSRHIKVWCTWHLKFSLISVLQIISIKYGKPISGDIISIFIGLSPFYNIILNYDL
jgi:hypothetical protein